MILAPAGQPYLLQPQDQFFVAGLNEEILYPLPEVMTAKYVAKYGEPTYTLITTHPFDAYINGQTLELFVTDPLTPDRVAMRFAAHIVGYSDVEPVYFNVIANFKQIAF